MRDTTVRNHGTGVYVYGPPGGAAASASIDRCRLDGNSPASSSTPTPAFPDGLTLLTGDGQFCCDSNDDIVKERSFVLVLLYPLRQRRESDRKIEQIREDYKAAFRQQSVLRVDASLPVWVSF